jgi:hypothetical protein
LVDLFVADGSQVVRVRFQVLRHIFAGSSDEGVGSSDERVRSSDERVRSSDERVGSSDERVGSSDERVGSSDERVGSSDERVGSSDERVRSSDERVGSSDERVGSSDEKVGSSDEKLFAGSSGEVIGGFRAGVVKRVEGNVGVFGELLELNERTRFCRGLLVYLLGLCVPVVFSLLANLDSPNFTALV